MKTVLILRHAKSSWNDPVVDDHGRRLNKRGEQDAPRMGELLKDEGLTPDHIITSTARRARETAKLVAEAAGYDGEIVRDKGLYEAPPEAYTRVIRALDENIQSVMLVGHNPTSEHLVSVAAGRPERMPTAALAHLTLAVESWKDADLSTDVELVHVWRPKELS